METWKPIENYENHYEVSDLGRVRSIDRFVPYRNSVKFCPSKIKKATPHYKNKYLSVLLKVEQVEKRLFVHRLVATAFIPNPKNKRTVNHIDADKNNNKASNLEWATDLENTRHSIFLGLTNTEKPVKIIKGSEVLEFQSRTKAGNFLGISDSNITRSIRTGIKTKGYNCYNL